MNRGQRCDSIAAQINTEHSSSHQLFVDHAIAQSMYLSPSIISYCELMNAVAARLYCGEWRRWPAAAVAVAGGWRAAVQIKIKKGKREDMSQSQSQSQSQVAEQTQTRSKIGEKKTTIR